MPSDLQLNAAVRALADWGVIACPTEAVLTIRMRLPASWRSRSGRWRKG